MDAGSYGSVPTKNKIVKHFLIILLSASLWLFFFYPGGSIAAPKIPGRLVNPKIVTTKNLEKTGPNEHPMTLTAKERIEEPKVNPPVPETEGMKQPPDEEYEAAVAPPVVKQVPPSPKVYIRKIKGKGKVQK